MAYKILTVLLLMVCQLQAKEIFVSPLGDDSNTGTKESPFTTF